MVHDLFSKKNARKNWAFITTKTSQSF
jgi:hypothetical protein